MESGPLAGRAEDLHLKFRRSYFYVAAVFQRDLFKLTPIGF